jgi:hypothetical protein
VKGLWGLQVLKERLESLDLLVRLEKQASLV